MCLYGRIFEQLGSFKYKRLVPFRFGNVQPLRPCKAHPFDADPWKQPFK